MSDTNKQPSITKAEIYTLRRLIECAEELDARPRPMCRDCADENGTCPNSGLECDMRKLFASAKALHNKLASPAATPQFDDKPRYSYGATREAGVTLLSDMPPYDRAQEAATPVDALAMLRYVLPYINSRAVDTKLARTGPMEDAYINTIARRFIERADQAPRAQPIGQQFREPMNDGSFGEWRPMYDPDQTKLIALIEPGAQIRDVYAAPVVNASEVFSFDDIGFGYIDAGKKCITKRTGPDRPSDMTNAQWYEFAGAVVRAVRKS